MRFRIWNVFYGINIYINWGDIMGHKRMSSFKDSEKYLKHRKDKVGGAGFEDSWVTDKKWLKENIDGFFSCKFCSGKMYGAGYKNGALIVSCRTPFCPGNIDSGMAGQIKKHQFDIRELTNQYLFNSMLKF